MPTLVLDEPVKKPKLVLDEPRVNPLPIVDPDSISIPKTPMDASENFKQRFLGRVDLNSLGWGERDENYLKAINKDPLQESARIRNIGFFASELNVSPEKVEPAYNELVRQIFPKENMSDIQVEEMIMQQQEITAERYRNFIFQNASGDIKKDPAFEEYDIYPIQGGILRDIMASPAGQIGKHFAKGALNIGYNVQRIADRTADFVTGGWAGGRSIYSEYLDSLGLQEANKTLKAWRDSPQLITNDWTETPFTRLFGITAESLPYTASMMVAQATGGTSLALGLGTAVEAGDVYDQMIVDGVPEKKALFVSAITGLLSAEIEQRITARNVKFAKGSTIESIRAFAKNIAEKAYDKVLKSSNKYTTEILVNSTVNALEEGGQYLTTTILPAITVGDWPKNPDGTIAWSKMKDDFKDAMVSGFLTSLIMESSGRLTVQGKQVLREKYHKVIDTAFKESKIAPVEIKPVIEKGIANGKEVQGQKEEVKPTTADEMIKIIESHKLPAGNLDIGQDYFKNMLPNLSNEELGKLLQWSRTQSNFIHRFFGGNVADQLRVRGEPVDVIGSKYDTIGTSQSPLENTVKSEVPAEVSRAISESTSIANQPVIPETNAEAMKELTPSRLAERTEELAIEKQLTKELGDLVGYEKTPEFMKEQARLAKAEMDNNYEQAKSIAMGEIQPSNPNLRPASVYEAVKFRATMQGDVETLRKLATQSTVPTRLSQLGQEIKAADVVNPEDPVQAIQDIVKTSEKSYERKTGQKASKAKKQGAKEIKDFIAKEIKKTTVKTWEDFIAGITC